MTAAGLANMLEARGGRRAGPGAAGQAQPPPLREAAMMRGEQKITASHLDRTAVIYLRQSTLIRSASTASHRPAVRAGRRGRPARLGCRRIEVIDCDWAVRRHATHREGFRELLGRVCGGRDRRESSAGDLPAGPVQRDLSRLLEVAR